MAEEKEIQALSANNIIVQPPQEDEPLNQRPPNDPEHHREPVPERSNYQKGPNSVMTRKTMFLQECVPHSEPHPLSNRKDSTSRSHVNTLPQSPTSIRSVTAPTEWTPCIKKITKRTTAILWATAALLLLLFLVSFFVIFSRDFYVGYLNDCENDRLAAERYAEQWDRYGCKRELASDLQHEICKKLRIDAYELNKTSTQMLPAYLRVLLDLQDAFFPGKMTEIERFSVKTFTGLILIFAIFLITLVLWSRKRGNLGVNEEGTKSDRLRNA
jgi:hypothetical protein